MDSEKQRDTNKKPHTQTGTITITRRGFGFVNTGEGDDIFIRQGESGEALTGDTVEIVPAGFEKGRRAGKVISVTDRHQTRFVGRIMKDDDIGFYFMADGKIYNTFLLNDENTKENVKAVIEFEGWDGEKNLARGKIVEIIGPVGDHETEMRALLLREGFSAEFPADVRNEAKELEAQGQSLIEKEIAEGKRRDFRGTTTFTIDPADAKDFDDALSIKELPDEKYEIGVHIADVSFFVRPGTAIEREAHKRATSVYLVDRTIPMLPPVLSENLCSLRPEEERLAMSAVFILDKNARVEDMWFGETIIYSDKRFSYEEAQEVLEQGKGLLHKELVILNTLSEKIRKDRSRRGGISFDTDEVKVEVNDEGTPVRIYLKERKETNLLIEDFMLLANESVATHMHRVSKEKGQERGFIYRIHDQPNEEKIENLSEFLKALDYKLPVGKDGAVTGKDLNQLFDQVDGTPEEDMIKTAAIRSMSKAIYTTKNIGHFGLAFEYYTHFTSPIRRYPDLLVHRLIKASIAGKKISKEDAYQLEEDAIHSTEREISATDAERDSIKLKQVEYMANHIGEEFDAVITGVIERGIFVAEKETRSEGMVHISSLKDDYYTFEEKNYRLVGEKTGKTYQLGDEVRVKLIAANPIERQLDFTLASSKENT